MSLEKSGSVEVEISNDTKTLKTRGMVSTISPSEAVKKAGRFYAASLVFAAVAVFIPLVHFVAVPTILLLGPLVAFLMYRMYNGKQDIQVTDARCPQCNGTLPLTNVLESWPLKEPCPHCQTMFSANILG